MTRRYGIALTIFAALILLVAGSARAGMVGHFSTLPSGPALNRGPVDEVGAKIDSPDMPGEFENSSKYKTREPVETGNLPESQDHESGDVNTSGNGEKPAHPETEWEP